MKKKKERKEKRGGMISFVRTKKRKNPVGNNAKKQCRNTSEQFQYDGTNFTTQS
jgi:hypothetical protein